MNSRYHSFIWISFDYGPTSVTFLDKVSFVVPKRRLFRNMGPWYGKIWGQSSGNFIEHCRFHLDAKSCLRWLMRHRVHHVMSFFHSIVQFNSIQFNSSHFTSPRFTSLHFNSIHFTANHFTSLHFNSFIHLAPSLGSKIGTHVCHTPVRSPGQHVVRVLHDWKGVIEVLLQKGFLQLKLLDSSPQIRWTRWHALSW